MTTDHARLKKAPGISTIAISVALCALVQSPSAWAQDAADATAEEPAAQTSQAEEAPNGEIVVTARKRAEAVQDVPISMAVLGSDTLAAQGINDVSNLDMNLANVSIGGAQGRGGNAGAITIRGIGETQAFVNRDPGVGLYIDDIYFGRSDGNFIGMLDTERVEVLRGPQGTLFGKNTTGGAVRVVSRQPRMGVFEGGIDATYGSYDRTDAKARINIPIGDTLALRFSGAYNDRDGWFLRESDGVMVDARTFKGGRAQLRWQPTSRLDVNLSVFYVDSRSNGGAVKLVNVNPATTRVIAYNRERAATDPVYDRRYITINPDSTFGGDIENYRFDGYFASATVSYELSEQLTVKGILGMNDNNVFYVNDRDLSPADVYGETIRQKFRGHSAELQLLGDMPRFQWVAGLYYFYENPVSRTNVAEYTLPNDPGEPSDLLRTTNQRTRSYAAFAQGTYEVTDWLSLTAGTRYTKEKKRLTSSAEDVRLPPIVVRDPFYPKFITGQDSFQDFSPAGTISIKPTRDILVYGTVAKGFRSGGINDVIDPNLLNFGVFGFDAETLWSYEVGVKSEWFDRRLLLNLSGFISDYKNLQVVLIDPVAGRRYTGNSGSAKIDGLEGESRLRIVPGLSVNGTLGLLRARYTSLGGTGPASPGSTLTLATPFPRSPKVTYSVGLQFEQDMRGNGRLNFSANYGYKADQQSGVQVANSVLLPAYALTTGRLQYTTADDRWFGAIFCTNCLGERYLTGGVNYSGVPGFGSMTNEIGDPFEAGVTLGFKF